jgi:hypothetical protein
MSLVYFISGYQIPNQLARLVSALHHEDDLFLIHIDSKVDSGPFAAALEEQVGHPANIEMLDPVRCDWAGFGLLEATLRGITRALHRHPSFTHLVLLTGQDYPIKPRDRIREHFDQHQGQSFMSWSAGDGPHSSGRRGNQQWYWDGDLTRLRRRYYLIGQRWIGIPNRFFPFARLRPLPTGLQPYQGLGYCCLANEAVRYAADFVGARPEVIRFFRRVLAPDENFFQMVLLNSPLRETIINEDLRYMTWKGWHPVLLRATEFPELSASPKMFARKFDMKVDSEILGMIDTHLLHLSTRPELQ